MHALEVIIARNAEAAGRESGHAANDGDLMKSNAIEDAHVEEPYPVKAGRAFHEGYLRGRQEG